MSEKEIKTEDHLDEEEDRESESSPFLDYLQTDNGHKLAERVVGVFEALQNTSVAQSGANLKLEKYIQGALILAVIIAVSVLTFLEKFTPSLGVLFGSLVGYVYGRRG